jgi:hypothetical protein
MFILCIVNIGVAFEKLLPINDMEKSKNKNEKGSPERKVRAQGGDSKFRPIAMALHTLFIVPDMRITNEEGEEIGLNFRVIAMTEGGLLSCINDMVEEHERISDRTWRSYKNGDVAGLKPDEYKYVALFISAYKKALESQRYALAMALGRDTPGAWQKWAWLLERRFEEFNQRTKTVDETPDVRRLVLRVSEKG